MAEIVKACDTSLPTRPLVAVKRILPHLCEDEQYRTMFMDESRVLAQLDHPNIIHAFEIGEVDGTPYIAMDYIDGQDARTLFHKARADGRVPLGIACHVIASVCDGLHHAHEQTDDEGDSLGLVHRDVSLQNVLLSYAGDVKITDFGIAVSSQNNARTEVGIVKGKFGYMSPEQIRGAPLDRRSDVFGAGICLYELLTGERLFIGDNDYKAIERVRNVDIDPPSKLNRSIPSDLERIVMKALAKQQRDRYQTASDMRRDLLSFMAAAGERCTREDLGGYLRTLFAHEYEAPGEDQTTIGSDAELEAARAALPQVSVPAGAAVPGAALDGTTGLAAFDHLDPVSGVDFESEVTSYARVPAAIPSLRNVKSGTLPPPGLQLTPRPPPEPQHHDYEYTPSFRPAPVVPPIVPHPDSIPGSMESPDPYRRNDNGVPEPRLLTMDWDEHEPTTMSQAVDGQGQNVEPAEDLMPDDEVTRVRTDEPLPGLAAAFEKKPIELAPPPEPSFITHREPTSRAPLVFPRPSLSSLRDAVLDANLVIKVGGGLVGLLVVVALLLYWTSERGAATIHLQTEPRDAIVSVDGKPVATTASPFVLSDLDSSEEHTIAVDKPGYQGWSTRLKLRPDQVLSLPVIRLEPDAPQPTAAPPATSIAPEPPLTVPSVEKPSEPRSKRASEPRTSERAKRVREPRVTGATSVTGTTSATGVTRVSESKQAAEPAAQSGGTGTLRINTRPWTRVTIDGRMIGNTPQMSIPLKAGKHSVQLANPDFGINKTLTVEIKSGEVVTRVLSLQ